MVRGRSNIHGSHHWWCGLGFRDKIQGGAINTPSTQSYPVGGQNRDLEVIAWSEAGPTFMVVSTGGVGWVSGIKSGAEP